MNKKTPNCEPRNSINITIIDSPAQSYKKMKFVQRETKKRNCPLCEQFLLRGIIILLFFAAAGWFGLRSLKLITDCNSVAMADELWQVCVQSVMWEACKWGKMKTRIPYESRNFIKGLESQNKIRNRNLTTNKEGETPPSFGFSKANVQLIFQLWKRLSLKNKAEAEHVQEQDAHARTLSSLMPSMHRQRCTKSLKRYRARNPSLYVSVSLKPLSSHERFF